jgi:hypothetical protein
MAQQENSPNRYRKASEDDFVVLDGIKDPKTRNEYIRVLREQDWVIFVPRDIDIDKLEDLLQRDPILKDWMERETDPVLIAERLVRTYPEIFYTIDHAFEVFTDWKLTLMKKVGFLGGNTEPPTPIPGHLLHALDDDELAMIARRQLRKEIKAMNEDPRGAIKRMHLRCKTEKHPEQKKMLEHLLALMKELATETYPSFHEEIVPGKPFPSMHVRLWVRQLRDRGNALIVGDVGTQKTSAASVGLDALGCRNTVVVCRSYAKEMWGAELKRYHRDQIDTLVFRGVNDFETLEQLPVKPGTRRFIVIGYGNLQIGYTDEEDVTYADRLVEAITRLKPDAIVIDEAHAIKGNGGRSQRVLKLARLKSVKHRLMLTATPFENNPNEVAHISTLLDPKNFPDENIFLGHVPG